ncbi:MAG: hypothetical protein ABFC31_13535 [Clostridiaceae bacterium]
MKSITKYFVLPIIGSIAFFLLLALTVLFILETPSEPVFGEKQAKEIFTEQKAAFETVCEFIDYFDLTPYKVEGEDTFILIERVESENAEETYFLSVRNGEVIPIETNDEAVINALEILFYQDEIGFVVQHTTANDRCVYFGIEENKGIVYSESGNEPQDTPAKVSYYFKKIDDNWFYWLDDN